ncbi:MAG: protein-glutamate O-methyltransferase CheR [Gemmatimonadaceae bacterium]
MSSPVLLPLPVFDDGFSALLQKIENEKNVACASYKERCVRRRISVRLRATGIHTFPEYSQLLDHFPAEWEKLLAALTINVTRFFRDSSAFAALEAQVYPLLAATFSAPLLAWSAGCSHGQEPYSIAMGLAETFGVDRFRMDATDIDRESLHTAACGKYNDLASEDIPLARRERWVSGANNDTINTALRSRVTVFRHDLLVDEMPQQRYHLITCRNAIIYFSREAQSKLFNSFYNALVPGGFLMLGKVETLIGPAREKFQSLNVRERLFRRPLV